MVDTWENPLGTEGFAFVEFAARADEGLGAVFEAFGFAAVARHRSRNIVRYRQGAIEFLLNMELEGPAGAFHATHGAGVSAMAFRVRDAAVAHAEALRRGAEAAQGENLFALPALESIGGARLYLVDAEGPAALDAAFSPVPQAQARPIGLTEIDHVAHNLRRGEVEAWSAFFERVFGFRQIRYFHIAGKQTAFKLRALASPCGKIRIPLNESSDEHSQIEDFIHAFRGAGVQHIGLCASDIHLSVESLREAGIVFQSTPDQYYEALPARVSGHSEDLARLKANGVLLDGDAEAGQLLQIFTKNAVGPMFFELIQRKGNDGFGEGNVTALFESIEADQIRRGALKQDA
jgi:4-hydroxyphenylpyruvate dioxygenase